MEEFLLFASSVVVCSGFALASLIGRKRYVSLDRLGPERLITVLGPWHNPKAWIALPREAQTIALTAFACWLLGWTWRLDRRGIQSSRYRAAGISLGILVLFFCAATWNFDAATAWVGPVEGVAWTVMALLSIRKERLRVAPRFRQTKALVRLLVFGGIQMFVRPALTPFVCGMLISAFNILVAFELFAPPLWRAWKRDAAWERDYYGGIRASPGGAYFGARDILATEDADAFLSWVENRSLTSTPNSLALVSEYRSAERKGDRPRCNEIARALDSHHWKVYVNAMRDVTPMRDVTTLDEEIDEEEEEEDDIVYAELGTFEEKP